MKQGRVLPVDRVGLLVGEFRAELAPELLGKLVGPGTGVDRLAIDRHPAVWISGAPHEVFSIAALVDGSVRAPFAFPPTSF